MEMEQLTLTHEEFENLLWLAVFKEDKLKSYFESLKKKKSLEINDDYLIFYIKRFADRQKCSLKEANAWLKELEEINVSSTFSILLKEIAVYLDLQYEDHIKNCKEIFVISLLDGKIHKVYSPQIKNYKNFAAFRNVEDAKKACRILKPYFKKMFGKSAK